MNYSIKVFLPESQEAVKEIVKEINEETICIINLDKMTVTDRQRAVDFMSGFMFGLGGSFVFVGDNVHICASDGVEIENYNVEQESDEGIEG